MVHCKRIRSNGQVTAETEKDTRKIKSDIGFAVLMIFCKRILGNGQVTAETEQHTKEIKSDIRFGYALHKM